MARIIEWDGQPFALLIEGDPPYLVPPIVLDENGAPVEGREILAAIVESGVTIQIPLLRNATPAMLAEVDQRMARISDDLAVPIGPPDNLEEAD